jgi:chloramphenicol 3-O-phosphotransferase
MAAVVITGAPGAGKSAVIEALSDVLAEADVEHAAFECEQLARGHPWLSFLATLPQLHEVLNGQRRAGRALFLVTATIETDAELEALIRAVEPDLALVVALRVMPETAARRVLHREPAHWEGRDALAEHAGRLAVTVPRLRGIDFILDTDHAVPRDVAHHIYGRMIDDGVI